jgi:hypothetical protein
MVAGLEQKFQADAAGKAMEISDPEVRRRALDRRDLWLDSAGPGRQSGLAGSGYGNTGGLDSRVDQ